MSVLIVEDSDARAAFLHSLVTGACVHRVDRGDLAIEFLRDQPVDLVFLDYDLAGKLTGLDVARVIARLMYPPWVVVHSMNMAGGTRIRSYLPESVFCPFRELKDRWRAIATWIESHPRERDSV